MKLNKKSILIFLTIITLCAYCFVPSFANQVGNGEETDELVYDGYMFIVNEEAREQLDQGAVELFMSDGTSLMNVSENEDGSFTVSAQKKLSYWEENENWTGSIRSLSGNVSLFSGGSEEISIQPVPYVEGGYVTQNLEVVESLEDAGLIETAMPNLIFTLFEEEQPSSSISEGAVSLYATESQWWREMLNVDAAETAGLTGEGVTIAVIDSGITAEHEDFDMSKILPESRSFIEGLPDSDIADTKGHGTFVSGLIGATCNNNLGIDGLAEDASIMVLRCFKGETASLSLICSAIQYAIDNDADIINMSLGITESKMSNLKINGSAAKAYMGNLLQSAADKGILIFAAVGNSGETSGGTERQYPAAYDCVIGVGSVDKSGIVSSFSQKNDSVFITAPGSSMTSLGISGISSYSFDGKGTSYATPMVVAMAAMAKQAYPQVDTELFKKLLIAAAEDKGTEGYDTNYGYGIAKADKMADLLTNEQSITYEINGGTVIGEYTSTYKIGEEVSLPTAIKDGYIFDGWYENEDYSGEPVTQMASGTVGDVTYYAKWSADPDISDGSDCKIAAVNCAWDSANCVLKVNGAVHNRTAESIEGTAVMGLYNRAGRLLLTAIKQVSVAGDSYEPVNFETDIPELSDGCVIKYMFLSHTAGYKPLSGNSCLEIVLTSPEQ